MNGLSTSITSAPLQSPKVRTGAGIALRRQPIRFLLCVAFTFTSVAQAQITAEQIDQVVKPAIAEWKQTGLAIAVVDGDREIVRAYGFRDNRSAAAVTPNTLFAIGSCSKSFASADVAKLVDDRKLRWDDPVAQYLPWFRTNDPWVTRALTARDILSHRTGLRAGMHRKAAENRRSYLESIATAEPLHPFRSQFSYTNDMFTLSGELVEALSGQRWEDFSRTNFWTPLGMKRTNADHRVAKRDTDSATPHVTVGDDTVAVPWTYEDFTALPSGGVNSTATDMARWLRFQMSDGTVNGRSILSSASMAEMHAPHTPVRGSQNGILLSSLVGRGESGIRFENYAMGWYTYDYRGHTALFHNGSITGFGCVMGMLPNEKFGVAVLVNHDSTMLPQSIFQRLVDLRLGVASKNWPTEFHQRYKSDLAQQQALIQAIDSSRISGTAPSRPLVDYSGRYEQVGGNGAIEIRLVDDKLSLTQGRMEYDAVHWHHEVFRIIPKRLRMDDGTIPWPFPTEHELRAFVSFNINERGRVSELTGQLGRFRHVPPARPSAASPPGLASRRVTS